MNLEIRAHLDEALTTYSQGIHYETMLEAKNEFFEITGVAHEEDSDFSAKMLSFNDWYLLQFISRRQTRTVIKDYIMKKGLGDDIAKALLEINFALFEYRGHGIMGKIVLDDLLHDKKISLDKNHEEPGLLKGDLFVGRSCFYKGENYLLSGLTNIPKIVKAPLVKQCKVVRKKRDPNEEYRYLLQVEMMKTKWLRYNRVDPLKIFSFS